MPSDALRIAALEQAVYLHGPSYSGAVLATADEFLRWLRAGGTPSAVRFVVGAPQDQGDDNPPSTEGPATMAAMNTGEKMKLTAAPKDASGYDVDVPVVYLVEDEGVATITDIADEPKSVYVVSGAPGSTVVTATVTKEDGTEITGTLAVDVVTAGVSVVEIEAGAPEPE
jgi:hypothetical protein